MKEYYPNFIAVLETALGSNGHHGLGYSFHNIGIFTNVFEDHLGIGKNLKKRSDIAKAKGFIFRWVAKDGCAIFNADDKLVCSQMKEIPKEKNVTLLPVGIDFKYFDAEKHLRSNGRVISLEDGHILLKSKKGQKKLIEAKKIHWTFGGSFQPSLYNLMFIIGALYFENKKFDKTLANLLENYTLDKKGGRLTLLEGRNGVKIIVDYAHEKYSLREIARLGNKMKQNKLIGVLRLAPDRTNKMISDTGKFVSNFYDTLIIYDKIDGVSKKRYVGRNTSIVREKGEVSRIFVKGILSQKKDGGPVERVVVEEKAIKRASELAGKGDVVVVICGDDHDKTINHVKKYFKATLAE